MSGMTKRDYLAVSGAIAEAANPDIYSDSNGADAAYAALRRAAQRIADHCERVNPTFDRKRFLEACGVS